MRRRPALTALMALGTLAGAGAVATAGVEQTTREYVVVLQQGASADAGRAAIERAGGTVERLNADVGVATARSSRADFASAATAQAAVEGAASARVIGRAPSDQRPRRDVVERLQREREAARGQGGKTAPGSATVGDPLSSMQWDMQAMHATVGGSYGVQQGSHDVRVGIIDTGVDGTHPDIAPNFDRALSRNFTVDDPVIDGPCADDPDGSCQDAPDVDEDGHGTHVAGTIGAALNGIGIAGVAPAVDLVNLRAGQDSGYFFVQPVVDALTYAGDHGIDVVNMSFYIDPWLYNCASNPADTPEQQAQQQTIVEATQRALDYARAHGVTLISAVGNEHTDLGRPQTDATSPDYPSPDASYDRTVDNSCLSMPTEGNGVLGVTSTGPSGRKAYYSNYGTEQSDVAAPGGDFRDFPGTDRYRKPENLILAPYPEAVGRANGDIAANGKPTTPFVVRDCQRGRCAYEQYLQGTSMASPHAVGVAALIVGEYGTPDASQGGVTLAPERVEQVLTRTATDTPCPSPRLYDYQDPDLPAEFDAYCEGGPKRNGFFGDGVVDALRAVQP